MNTRPPEWEEWQGMLERHLQDFLQERRLQLPAGEWLDGLYFDLCEYVGRKGKRVRPMLFLMTLRSLGAGGGGSEGEALKVAAALELLHAFVLIHDDVIDRSEFRRGLPTFHRLAARRLQPMEGAERTGEHLAIVAGNLLFALAVERLVAADFPEARKRVVMEQFLQAAAETGAGEMFDVLLGARDISRVRGEDIEQMYHWKTTRYTFELPLVAGAVLAGAGGEAVELLRRAAGPLGLAFQIDNDLQEYRRAAADGVWSDDLLDGKKTCLVWEAFRRLDGVDRSFLQMCLGTRERTEARMLKLRDLIDRSGAVGVLEERVGVLMAEARQGLVAGLNGDERLAGVLECLLGPARRQIRIAA